MAFANPVRQSNVQKGSANHPVDREGTDGRRQFGNSVPVRINENHKNKTIIIL